MDDMMAGRLRHYYFKFRYGIWRSLQELLFVRIIPLAEKCSWCGRLMPREWRYEAGHLHFSGHGKNIIGHVFCTQCANTPSVFEWMYPVDDDYYDDPFDMDAHSYTCEMCGGEIAGSYSTCICDQEDEDEQHQWQ